MVSTVEVNYDPGVVEESVLKAGRNNYTQQKETLRTSRTTEEESSQMSQQPIFALHENLVRSDFLLSVGVNGRNCSHCTVQGAHFHCKLYTFSLMFKYKSKLLRHIEQSHLSSTRLVNDEMFVIIPCKIPHTEAQTPVRFHYHCPYCSKAMERQDRFLLHLKAHGRKGCRKSNSRKYSQKKIDFPLAGKEGHEEQEKSAPEDEGGKDFGKKCVDTKESSTNAARIIFEDGLRTSCDICGKSMLHKSMKRHLTTKHPSREIYKAVCCDRALGLYMVRNSPRGGVGYPIHVQKILHGGQEKVVDCENEACRQQMATASRSGMTGRECSHLLDVNHAFFPTFLQLDESKWQEMGTSQHFKVLTTDTIQKCIDKNTQAIQQRAPTAVECKDNNFLHVSIFDGKYMSFPVRSRYMVSYNSKDGRMTCKCNATKWFCIHKAILYQTDQLSEHASNPFDDETWPTHGDYDDHTQSAKSDKNVIYPPRDDSALLNMIEYMIGNKKIPFLAPKLYLNLSKAHIPKVFRPIETHCHLCRQQLPKPLPVTFKGKILCMSGIINNIETYVKFCNACQTFYRYQEYTEGVHNFNDVFLLGLDVCLYIRESLKNHVAVGTLCNILAGIQNVKLDQHTIIDAYNHFEALTDRSYNYNCVACGFYPPILIADVNRKVAFKCSSNEEDLPDVMCPESDKVDWTSYWNMVEKSIIAKGFRGRKVARLQITPKMSFWSPFIGAKSRIGNTVFNSEHRKVSRVLGVDNELECRELSEERLCAVIMEGKLREIQAIAESVGISRKGSKLDIVNRIKSTINNKDTFNKVFKKMFGSSGGWLSFACVHGIIYAAKFLLRAESPRDYIDVMRSFKHRPNILICDMAHMVARHENKTCRNLFAPFEGRVAEATEENIAFAKDGNLHVSFPWLHSSMFTVLNSFGGTHPVTGSNNHFALFDKFHESNSSDAKEVLRRIGCVKELRGRINSEAVEQIHGMYDLNINFMNRMNPVTHIFMFRSIIDLKNEELNALKLRSLQSDLNMSIAFDHLGRAIFRQEEQLGADARTGGNQTTEEAPNTIHSMESEHRVRNDDVFEISDQLKGDMKTNPSPNHTSSKAEFECTQQSPVYDFELTELEERETKSDFSNATEPDYFDHSTGEKGTHSFNKNDVTG